MVSRIPSPLPCLKVLEVFDAGSIVCLYGTKAWRKWMLASALSQHSTCSSELFSWLQSEFVQLRHTCKPLRYKGVSPRKRSLWADTCHFWHHKAFKWSYVWQEEQKCGKPKLRCIDKCITSNCGITTVFCLLGANHIRCQPDTTTVWIVSNPL